MNFPIILLLESFARTIENGVPQCGASLARLLRRAAQRIKELEAQLTAQREKREAYFKEIDAEHRAYVESVALDLAERDRQIKELEAARARDLKAEGTRHICAENQQLKQTVERYKNLTRVRAGTNELRSMAERLSGLNPGNLILQAQHLLLDAAINIDRLVNKDEDRCNTLADARAELDGLKLWKRAIDGYLTHQLSKIQAAGYGRMVAGGIDRMIAEIARLKTWRRDVTAALMLPGGTTYEDVPHRVRKLAESDKHNAGEVSKLKAALQEAHMRFDQLAGAAGRDVERERSKVEKLEAQYLEVGRRITAALGEPFSGTLPEAFEAYRTGRADLVAALNKQIAALKSGTAIPSKMLILGGQLETEQRRRANAEADAATLRGRCEHQLKLLKQRSADLEAQGERIQHLEGAIDAWRQRCESSNIAQLNAENEQLKAKLKAYEMEPGSNTRQLVDDARACVAAFKRRCPSFGSTGAKFVSFIEALCISIEHRVQTARDLSRTNDRLHEDLKRSNTSYLRENRERERLVHEKAHLEARLNDLRDLLNAKP